MQKNANFGARFGAHAALLLITLSLLAVGTQAEYLGDVNDIEVYLETDDHPTLVLYKDDAELYGVRFSSLTYQSDDLIQYDFAQADWNVEYQLTPHEKFPHISIRMDSEIQAGDTYLGHLYLSLNVFSTSSISEITFSFRLENIPEMSEGRFFILQDIFTPGVITRTPSDIVPGKAPIEFFELSVNDHRGYFSWSTDARVDGSESETVYIDRGNDFFLGVDYNPEADTISINSIELEKTMVGSSILPVPEPISRLPSLLVGILIGSSFIVGVAVEKRREFYKNRDTTSVVRLEDSPYYRGK